MKKFRCTRGNGHEFVTGLVYTLEADNSVDTNQGNPVRPCEYSTGIEWLEKETDIRFEEVIEE